MTEIAAIIFDAAQKQRALHPDRPALIGVAGAQGSGKTTACQLLEAANRPRFANFSIDDLYFGKAERERNADGWASTFAWAQSRTPAKLKRTTSSEDVQRIVESTRPLFVTRGPPGTHDLRLARGVIARLGTSAETLLPRFDKIADVRKPEESWPVFHGPAEAILIDGWCLGALPVPDSPPLNDVEREDVDGQWRGSMNSRLELDYVPFSKSFDAIIYLQPPSWEIVRRWRGQQEVTLRGRPLTEAEEAWIDRFIMHYERITRSMMEGNHMATTVVRVDEERRVISAS